MEGGRDGGVMKNDIYRRQGGSGSSPLKQSNMGWLCNAGYTVKVMPFSEREVGQGVCVCVCVCENPFEHAHERYLCQPHRETLTDVRFLESAWGAPVKGIPVQRGREKERENLYKEKKGTGENSTGVKWVEHSE